MVRGILILDHRRTVLTGKEAEMVSKTKAKGNKPDQEGRAEELR